MLVDLISVNTSDGIALDGAFFPAATDASSPGAVDAILLIHGSGGRFYAPATRIMAEELSLWGYPCLALNTRGHDTVWVDTATGVAHGNAFEILDISRHDLRAGVDFLAEKGYQRIGLLGHSMGAVKVTYYAAWEDDPRVRTVIPVSPVRLSYAYYMESPDAQEFQGNLERADQMESEGRALELMKAEFPITQYFSAASYLDKHGPAERYNLVTLAPRVKIPLFTFAGSLETHTRLIDMASDLALAAVNSPRPQHIIIDGGNHSLQNRKEEAALAVLNWLASLAPEQVPA